MMQLHLVLTALAVLVLFTDSVRSFMAATPMRPAPFVTSTASTLSASGAFAPSFSWLPQRRLSSNRNSAGCTGPRMSTGASTEQKGLVTVYHKDTCPYCTKALALLEEEYELGVTRVDVLGEDSDKKIKQMKTFSGRDTVPQIFFNSDHIGGNDDLQKLHMEGKLPDLVAKVRAEAPGMMKDTWYHPWY